MKRAKLTGLRRNIAVAIGNTRDPEAVHVLTEADEERPSGNDAMVQDHIRWAHDMIES